MNDYAHLRLYRAHIDAANRHRGGVIHPASPRGLRRIVLRALTAVGRLRRPRPAGTVVRYAGSSVAGERVE